MSRKTNPPDDSADLILKRIGTKVRELRKKQEKNYEEFARKHRINKVTLQRLETGQNFTMKSLIEVLGVLEISLEDFFSNLDD